MNKKKIFIILAVLIVTFFVIPEAIVRWVKWIDWQDKNSIQYRGGCIVNDYINGECIFEKYHYYRHQYAGVYPPITQDDSIWDILKKYSKDDLMKIANEELEKWKNHEKYKFQEQRIARIQGFIDILSKR